jgi:sugar diacid utilization regulator/putative methionine-R-sulfoxide reductase with GAF domain
LTTQLGRTETESPALARSERRRRLQWWAQIEAAAGGSWPDVLAALTAAVELQTDRFVVVQGVPPLCRVHVSGRATTPVDLELLLAVANSGDELIRAGWQCLPIDDDYRLLVEDPAVADRLTPMVTAARLAGQVQHVALSAAGAEVEALGSVATRILRARELDEALLAVTNETLGLLNSDIAGVMLREGDEIVMRACAGNQLADTGNLRMRRGQGLAGHVFATGQAAKVDDYLRNDVISNDFNYLARAEKTRSALGAPLVVDGEVIGVLEVWRRRESTFSPGDIRRLVALADLAAIALDNARQHEISQASQHAVQLAHHALQVQLGKVEHALVGQQALIEALIEGEQLPGIVRIVSERSGCQVVLLDADLDLLAGPAAVPELDAIRRAIRERGQGREHGTAGTTWTELVGRWMAIRAVRTGTEEIGWVCLLTTAKAGDESIELAATQAALTFALQHLEQQAAAKARASMREDLLLNLLKGSADERRGAVARAKYLQIDLRGPLRIAACTFAGLDSLAQAAGWSSPNLDQVRRRLFHQCEGALTEVGLLRLAAANGNGMIALIHSADGAELRAALDGVVDGLRAGLPHCQPIWGVSGPHTNPQQLDRAHAEAATALQALRQDSGRRVAFYEDLGVLALLIAGPQGLPLSKFAGDTIGPILAHDARHGTSLVETLRTYLDVNCSQKDTAQRLFVHQKTVKYRLETIEKLTGLNLHEHSDRMRADIAVRANDLQ